MFEGKQILKSGLKFDLVSVEFHTVTGYRDVWIVASAIPKAWPSR
jgi:hypothetical protein